MRSTGQQAVLDAALALVEEGGLGAVTISALTARSGVSNGSVYHHFGSRAGVFAVLYGESFAHCVAAMLAALDVGAVDSEVGEVGDAEKAVRAMVARYLEWVVANPGRARFLYAAPLTADPAAKAEVFAPIAHWFEARMAAGEVREFPLWALDPIVMGPAHECARRYLTGGLDLTVVGEFVGDAVWAAVAPVG